MSFEILPVGYLIAPLCCIELVFASRTMVAEATIVELAAGEAITITTSGRVGDEMV